MSLSYSFIFWATLLFTYFFVCLFLFGKYFTRIVNVAYYHIAVKCFFYFYYFFSFTTFFWGFVSLQKYFFLKSSSEIVSIYLKRFLFWFFNSPNTTDFCLFVKLSCIFNVFNKLIILTTDKQEIIPKIIFQLHAKLHKLI